MNTLKVTGAFFLTSALLLGGCGNSNKNANDPNREDATITQDKDKEGGTLQTGDGYGFNSFDLEIDVDGKDVVDAEYEIDKNAEGEYENTLKNEKFKDEEAMNALDELFVAILLTKDTTQEEAKKKILEYYQLEDYSKFDLEVKFDDGTILDFEDMK
jgi:major membrane immunogen (membrane-anchored lipoprotein)